MRVLVALISLALIFLLLAEFFVVFLLPRRVKRDPRIARRVFGGLWRPWRAIARRVSPVGADTLLGLFGPLGLLAILAALSLGVILGFSGLHWANSSHFGGRSGSAATVPGGLYFSSGAFFSASTSAPGDGLGKALQVAEAATGFAFLAIAIGYLPALFQAFSRRETAVSRLDPRAGSPPTPGALLERSGARGGWKELDEYLREWESWAAELMETHLSYPMLAYYRSQHVNQNWLAALTTIVDACAFAIAFGPEDAVEAAELTFAIGRHALADLSHTIVRRRRPPPPYDGNRRLGDESLAELCSRLEGSGLHTAPTDTARSRLMELRASYEPNAIILSDWLALPLPGWLQGDDQREYWRTSHGHSQALP